MPKLLAYHTGSELRMALRPARPERAWMEATRDRFAHRCLPLLMANESGWEVLAPHGVAAVWDGGATSEAIHLDHEGPPPHAAMSHFGHGVLTFRIPYVFRTPPGWNLCVQGPPNLPRDGLQALSGLVETDAGAATFTMNYLFTRPGRAAFAPGEPIAFLTPVPRGLEAWEPEVLPLEADPALAAEHRTWAEGRGAFIEALQVPGTEARKQRWQRDYVLAAAQKRLRLKPFRAADASSERG